MLEPACYAGHVISFLGGVQRLFHSEDGVAFSIIPVDIFI
jgi:hypothetical protein